MTEEEVDNGKGVTEEVWVELQNDLFSNSNFFQLNKRLRPLNDVVPNSNFFDPYLWVFVMGRCSSLQMVNLRFDDPNPDQRFEDMRFFMEKNGDFIDQVSPSESGGQRGMKKILIHEYFLDKYQEVEDSEWLPGDRYVCSEYKKGMEKR